MKFDSLKLKKEVSRITMDIEPDDVLSVKDKLKKFGYQKEPGLTGASEIAGAIVSPAKFTKISPKALLQITNRKNLLDSLANGGVYCIGVSKNDTKDYVNNITSGDIGSVGGHIAGNIFLGRGSAHPLARKSVGAAVGYATQSMCDGLEKK